MCSGFDWYKFKTNNFIKQKKSRYSEKKLNIFLINNFSTFKAVKFKPLCNITL